MFVILNSTRYVSPSSARAIRVLKNLAKRHLQQAKESREHPENDLEIRRWVYHSKASRAYSKLVHHLKVHPENTSKVLKALSENTLHRQFQVLQDFGIDVSTTVPGAGVYLAPDLMERQPSTPKYPIKVVGHGR